MADRALLADTLETAGRVVIAVSGGIDSLTLATFAWRLRPAVQGVSFCFADGAAVPRSAASPRCAKILTGSPATDFFLFSL
jgi:PP-loop superfamily ATP-utilizing enzyme